VRLRILQSIAEGDDTALRVAIQEAAGSSELALLELAPIVARYIDRLGEIPPGLAGSIAKYRNRWLPLIRRRLEAGNTPVGRVAASLLDEYGALEDVGLLRAYAKTYSRRGPARSLGKQLAKRVSPALRVRDLGRVELQISERTIDLSRMRRKPAAVLMYLITRPSLAANREQVLDELWRDADPGGALNNLNQSLYFLRREIDPWYEDDVSVDYVNFQGDLVWLDRGLVQPESVQFLAASQDRDGVPTKELLRLVSLYRAPFAPEFEYEEWAMGWRARVHSAFLDLSHHVITRCVAALDLAAARTAAAHVLSVDESATDVERQLIWLYGRLGLASAARAQYGHLRAVEDADGLASTPLDELLRGPFPS
jgi:DNA-binding SARP family transcriptional activator